MQVFSVPVEEQRLKEMSEQQFGERGRVQTRICLEIMARTGTRATIWCWGYVCMCTFFPLPFLPFPFHIVPFPLPLPHSPPQIQLGGLGECCKLPQRGLRQSPGSKCILMHLWVSKCTLWQHLSFSFPPNISYDAKCVIPPRFRRPRLLLKFVHGQVIPMW